MTITMYDDTSLFEIKGGRKKVRERLLSPLLWSKNALIPKHSVHITLQLKDLGSEYFGFCLMESDNHCAPREFIIELNKNCDIENNIVTLFHEMVHVKQYVRNELQIRMRPLVHRKWKGTAVDENEVDYYNLPWEKEAYEMQTKLYKEWLDDCL